MGSQLSSHYRASMSRHCLDAPEVLATGRPDSLTDITEIKPQQGKLYLCIVRYLYDQRVVGCSQWCVPWWEAMR
jgi:hypothetical protein